MQDLAFFVGKGGVGKTTVSAAYAVHNALNDPRKTVLLLSTDPAHSLADVLHTRLGSRPSAVRLPGKGKLYAWQIDAEERFRAFLDQYRENILRVVEMGSIFTREDIEPLIDASLPGMAEMAALLAINDAVESGKYARIVVDTAPFGHTLRLFSLPQQFLRFLEFLELSASRDQVLAAHFGGRAPTGVAAFLADWRTLLEGMQRALSEQANIFLVTTAEKFSLNEAVRCRDILARYSPPIAISSVVLNRVVRPRWREPVLSPSKERRRQTTQVNCPACRERQMADKQAQAFLEKNFSDATTWLGEDPGSPIVGADDLARFGDHVFDRKRLVLKIKRPKTTTLPLNKVQWPVLEVPLSFVLGKGGVGKTTISAALGFTTRKRRKASVEICSVDPAPSLDDIFQKDIGDRPQSVLGDDHFHASEFDAAALFRRWVAELKSSVDAATTSEVSGIHVDLSFERRLLEQLLDIVPPGVDEVLAIFRILDLLGADNARVLIDMAPTGHALELLRMPERVLSWTRPLLKTLATHRTLAVARDAGVKVAELAHRVRELVAVLNDPDQVQVWAVMLPEPLPDRETERLIAQLRNLHLPPKAVFINRVLFAKDVAQCARCRSAMAWQRAMLASIRKRYSTSNIYVVRNFADEIVGKAGLKRLTAELWQLG